MPWRGKRKNDKPEEQLAAATIARGPNAAATESAVRSVLARIELERPLASLVVVDLDGESLAGDLGGMLEVRVVRIDDVVDADGVVVVASSSTPAGDVVAALEPIQSVLIGVVLVEADVDAVAQDEPADGNDALAALVELERVAGSQGAPVESPRVVVPEPSAEDELERRLTELTHREAALRRMVESIEQQRTRLEEREQALERDSSGARVSEEQLAAALRRAAQAEEQVRALQQQVAALEAQLAEAEEHAEATLPAAVEEPVSAPAEPAPASDGTYTLQRLEKLIADAQLRGDPEAEEWAYYLPLLREHASFDGRIPAQFDSLIDSVFGAALG